LNLYEDRDGDIWVGTVRGIAHLTGDRFAAIPSLPKVGVFPIGEDQSGGLYMTVATKGVFRLENYRPISVTPEIGATHMVETKEGDAWISGFGIYQFQPAGLQGLRGHDEPLDYATFGRADGLDAAECGFGFPNSALTPDGKLWVATPQGLAMLDLPRLPRTDRKPAIYMEEVTVGRNRQFPGHELVLPPGTHHVELDFDAVEISSPEKIHLQYRLDNSVDSEWLDTGHPAHAIYSNIPAGTHAFHVRACNRDGIWYRAGMTVYTITQQPYLYETAWFRIAAILAGCLLLWTLYLARVKRIAHEFNMRLEERLAERGRIARELHDTLLQGFQGLTLHFQAVLDHITDPESARNMMQKALSQADRVLLEARERVHDLRAEGTAANELSQMLASFGDELVKDRAVAFKVTVVGAPQSLPPVLGDEISRIAREAVGNAVRHSQASSIEVEITYARSNLSLRIRDNGCGIDPEILGSGRQGHWGLSGMRERARKIGGQLNIWSNPGNGTEIDLTIPAKVAYPYGPKESRWRRIKRGRNQAK
jgi:signal transduction histidine kinase